jgi:oligopeptidase B
MLDKYEWLKDKNWKNFKACDYEFDSKPIERFIEQQSRCFNKLINDNEKEIDLIIDEIDSRANENSVSMLSYINGSIYYFRRKNKNDKLPTLFCSHTGETEKAILDLNFEYTSNNIIMFSAYRVSTSFQNIAFSFFFDGKLGQELRISNYYNNEKHEISSDYASGIFEWCTNTKLLFVEYDPSYSYQKLYIYDIQSRIKENIYLNTNDFNLIQNILLEYVSEQELIVSYYIDDIKCYVHVNMADQHKTASKLNLNAPGVTYFRVSKIDQYFIALRKNNHNRIEVVKGKILDLGHIEWQSIKCSTNTLEILDYRTTSHGIVIEVLDCKLNINVYYSYNLEGDFRKFSFGSSVYSACFISEQNIGEVIIKYSTPLVPSSYYMLDNNTGKTTLVYVELPQNVCSENYIVERKYAKSRDGENIPLTLIYSKLTKIDSSAALILNVYGAYCVSLLAEYNVGLFSLLDRGVVYCLAHVRGGGEKGLEWHKSGRLEKKKNSSNDLVDACDFLIDNRYTSIGQIGLMTASAGGIIAGDVLNNSPNLIKVVVFDSPFLDVLNSLSDPEQDMTPNDWREFGNPLTDENAYKYIRSYCPYQNIKIQEYPSILFNISLCDGNVGYWESFKYYSKVNECKTNDSNMFLNIDKGSTHLGCSDVLHWRKKVVISYVFLLKELGVEIV